jgi:large repetitive protein
MGHNPPNPSSDSSNVSTPLLSLSFEDGQKLKASLAAGTVIASKFYRGEETKRDGTIDNTVVAHEWGHYLHHRLVLCGSPSCGGMSEGFGDFTALLMVVREGDTFDGKTFAFSQYASAGLSKSSLYYGIRRAPYSVDLTRNPFTFTHVRRSAELPTTAPLQPSSADMAEVHNVGEIWAQALFDGYVNLLQANAGLPFEQIKRRMTEYIVAGLKHAPVDPTFVEQRDAILSSVRAIAKDDPARAEDFLALAKGFAKRGLGSGAIAPPTSSESLDEAVEDFSIKGNLMLDSVSVDDSVSSCDSDGHLDAGEAGVLALTLVNGGWGTLSQSSVRVTSSDPDFTFDDGGMITLNPLEPYQSLTVKLGVEAAPGATRRGLMPLTITPADPEAVIPSVDLPYALSYNYDDRKQAASSDDVESDLTPWTTTSDTLPDVWTREGDSSNHVWHGDDIGAQGVESLISPDLTVSAFAPLVISFQHRYSFEFGPEPNSGLEVAFDGGLLEISSDGGATWRDVAEFAYVPYTQTLFVAPEPDGGVPDGGVEEYLANPLAGRRAWGGESEDYPEYSRVSINLGYRFARQTVKLRFRLGTDEGTGAPGWDIDDISFGGGLRNGISNTPFTAVVDDGTRCD